MYKLLKDPLYGYISIEKKYMDIIVDNSAFQRLRHVSQTSYSPLYSTALHNRFVHSIGVYHLGKIASTALEKSIEDGELISSNLEKIKKLKKVFEIACLLHDIGHSPFSHTGEYFYLKEEGSKDEPLYKELLKIINNDIFFKDFETARVRMTLGKPHEIMSAFLGIKLFSELFCNQEFFARCIIGLLYTDLSSVENQIKNAYIQLLNSSCIDVDKIDYLLRDAYVTGYETISIDYKRLLTSVKIKKDSLIKADGTPYYEYKLAFGKKSISVLENVVYAHDSERKWIQNHPVILYESFIIKNSIEKIVKYYNGLGLDIFSFEALLMKGIEKNDKKISLLCDDDFIVTMKNFINNDLIREYFDRTIRRHPVWKSESEYMALFGDKGEWGGVFTCKLGYLDKFLTEEAKSLVNNSVISLLDEKIKEIEKLELESMDKESQIQRYKTIKEIVNALKDISEELNIPFDFVIIKTGMFNSGFSKDSIKNLNIDFPDIDKTLPLSQVTNLLGASPSQGDFYFIFYKRKGNETLSSHDFAMKLFEHFK